MSIRSVFSDDSKLLASGSTDRSVRVWSMKTRSLICDLRGHTGSVSALAFSSDSRNVLSGSEDGTIRVWGVNETAPVDQQSIGDPEGVSCVSYVPNRDFIVYGTRDGGIYVCNTHTGEAVGKPMQDHIDAVNALAVSSDGQWLVSGSSDKTLRI